MYITDKIIPYEGTASIALYQHISDVRNLLSDNDIQYREEVWSSESETIPNAWTLLIIEDVMSLFFAANGKLFKIVLWRDYQGCLPNGIHTRMQLKEAQKLDPALTFDDWNEDYESPNGYWLEDNIDSGEVSSISIFIKEILDEEQFDYCEW